MVRFVATQRSFGVSTHLYHGVAADSRAICSRSARTGFETVEVFATRIALRLPQPGGRRRPAAVAGGSRAGAAQRARAGRRRVFGGTLECAAVARQRRSRRASAGRGGSRARAADRAADSVQGVRRCTLACRAGAPTPRRTTAATPRGEASRHLQPMAEPLGVRIARRGRCRTSCRAPARSCISWNASSMLRDVGICLDFGHAHLDGDLVDAIETVSEHLIAVDVHDNHGRTDDHLVPFEGTIDWAGGADGGAEGRLRRAADVRDRRTRSDQGNARGRAGPRRWNGCLDRPRRSG